MNASCHTCGCVVSHIQCMWCHIHNAYRYRFLLHTNHTTHRCLLYETCTWRKEMFKMSDVTKMKANKILLIYLHVYVCVCVCVCVCAYMHTYIYIYIYIHEYSAMCAYLSLVYVCVFKTLAYRCRFTGLFYV